MKKNIIGKTSLEITQLGFGASRLGNQGKVICDEDSFNTVKEALKQDINYFDTAPYYGFGLGELRLGKALLPNKSLKDKIIISTKVGRVLDPIELANGESLNRFGYFSSQPFQPRYDYSYDGVMRSFESSLKRLKLSRINILYMHDIGAVTHKDCHQKQFKIAIEGGYKAMDELRSQGVVDAIGLGVNEYEVCEQAMDHVDVDCFLLAGRYTLLEQKSLDTFLPKCVDKNIAVILGGPFNSGILAKGARKGVKVHYDYMQAPPNIIHRVQKIEEVCDEYHVSLHAAALQFPLCHEAIVSVLPGFNNPHYVRSSVEAMQSVIPYEFWQALKRKKLLHESAPVDSAF